MLHQCDERVKGKSQKVFGPNSYICRSCREKTGLGAFLVFPPHPDRVNEQKAFEWLVLFKNSLRSSSSEQLMVSETFSKTKCNFSSIQFFVLSVIALDN